MSKKPTYEGSEREIQALEKEIPANKRIEDQILEQRNLALALSATGDLDEGLRLCLDAAIRVAGLECGGIYLFDKDFQSLDLVAHQGL